jgi:hypothetical protein
MEMREPCYTCCEDGMLSQEPPTDRSGLCPACKSAGKLRRLTDEELAQELRVPGTLTWGQCRNMAEALRAQGVVAYDVAPAEAPSEREIIRLALKHRLTGTDEADRENLLAFARELVATAGVPASRLPPGWKIERRDSKPFKVLNITAPNGYSSSVGSHERNPMNVLYMLAEALLEGDAGAPEAFAEQHLNRHEVLPQGCKAVPMKTLAQLTSMVNAPWTDKAAPTVLLRVRALVEILNAARGVNVDRGGER